MGSTDQAPDPGQSAADLPEHRLALDRVTAHDLPLRSVELPRLVDDLCGDADLADVVQHGGELDVASAGGVETQFHGHVNRQLDDLAGVHAGVMVDRLDHVAQELRCAAVGGAERQRAAQSLLSLVGEQRQQSDQRKREQQQPGVGHGRSGDRDTGAGEATVGQIQPGHLRLLGRTDALGKPGPRESRRAIEQELGGERETQQRKVRPGERLPAGHNQHQDRTQRVEAVADPRGDTRRRRASAQHLGAETEHRAARHDQRHERHRQHEQHRHEDQLSRGRPGAADREPDPRRDQIRRRREREHGDREWPGPVAQHRHQARADEEHRRGRDFGHQHVAGQAALGMTLLC